MIGGAGLIIANALGNPLAGISFVAGSVLPDLDVFLMAFGKRFYLRNHQGVTHSLLLAPLFAAVLIAWPLSRMFELGFDNAIFFGAWLGIIVHILLDLSNTFRIQLWAPFSRKRFSLDAVFFIDSVTLGITGLFYLCFGLFGFRNWMFGYPAIIFGYITLKWMLQRSVRRRLGALAVIPSALNPFEFYILNSTETDLKCFQYNGLTGKQSGLESYPQPSGEVLALASKSELFKDMQQITRALRIVSVEEQQGAMTIKARDLAVRNFGGKFGSTQLVFGKNEELLDESAAI